MGMTQNLARLACAGNVTIQAITENGETWYMVILDIDGNQLAAYDPELDKAIFTVKRMLDDHNSRMNMARLGEILARNPVKISDKKG